MVSRTHQQQAYPGIKLSYSERSILSEKEINRIDAFLEAWEAGCTSMHAINLQEATRVAFLICQ